MPIGLWVIFELYSSLTCTTPYQALLSLIKKLTGILQILAGVVSGTGIIYCELFSGPGLPAKAGTRSISYSEKCCPRDRDIVDSLPASRIKPGTAGWEARTRPLCQPISLDPRNLFQRSQLKSNHSPCTLPRVSPSVRSPASSS